MPQIRIEYSRVLDQSFRRRDFALALNRLAAPLIGSRLASFKTRLVALEETVIGDGADTHAMIHVDFRLLSGRPAELKQELGRAVLALLQDHAAPVAGLDIQLTVEIRDLDRPHYHKAVLAAL